MNLMLIGGGQLIAPSHQVINRHVFQLTTHVPHIVFLPTASRDERLYQQQFRSTYESLGATFSIVTLFDDNQTIDTQRQLLQHADIIYVGGGHYPLLVKTLEDTGMDVLLKQAVERGTSVSVLGQFIRWNTGFTRQKVVTITVLIQDKAGSEAVSVRI